jgi:hypothetical protein
MNSGRHALSKTAAFEMLENGTMNMTRFLTTNLKS